MRKMLWFSVFLLSFSGLTIAQKTRDLKQVLELKILEERGANGASVAWHPVLKRYYAAIAGNAEHPFGVFDAMGKPLSKTPLTTLVDVRGLWYNPKVKTFQANTYADGGLVQYKLDEKGKPISFIEMPLEMEKPNEQSVGAFDPIGQVVYYYRDGSIDGYSIVDGTLLSTTELHLSYISEAAEDEGLDINEDLLDYYNYATVIYTGIKNAEWGLLNIDEMQVELYSKETGYLTQVLKFPKDAPPVEAFNFSFANATYWLFNKDERKWVGYK
jgi:hypothetical protein